MIPIRSLAALLITLVPVDGAAERRAALPPEPVDLAVAWGQQKRPRRSGQRGGRPHWLR